MPAYKRFQVFQDGDVTIIRLVDKELSDLLMQDEFLEEVMGLIENEKPGKLLINFQVVDYCTTGIINTLINAKRRLIAQQGRMKLCALSQHVHEAFRALNLEGTVFDVYESESDGVAAFAE